MIISAFTCFERRAARLIPGPSPGRRLGRGKREDPLDELLDELVELTFLPLRRALDTPPAPIADELDVVLLEDLDAFFGGIVADC